MTEIWAEFARFDKSQRIVDQARMVLKKVVYLTLSYSKYVNKQIVKNMNKILKPESKHKLLKNKRTLSHD